MACDCGTSEWNEVFSWWIFRLRLGKTNIKLGDWSWFCAALTSSPPYLTPDLCVFALARDFIKVLHQQNCERKEFYGNISKYRTFWTRAVLLLLALAHFAELPWVTFEKWQHFLPGTFSGPTQNRCQRNFAVIFTIFGKESTSSFTLTYLTPYIILPLFRGTTVSLWLKCIQLHTFSCLSETL